MVEVAVKGPATWVDGGSDIDAAREGAVDNLDRRRQRPVLVDHAIDPVLVLGCCEDTRPRALAAAYAIGAPPGGRAATEAMVTIDPPRRSIMPPRKVLTVRNVEVRLRSTSSRHSSSAISVVGCGGLPPPAKAN